MFTSTAIWRMPSIWSIVPCRREFSQMPSAASITSRAASAREAPEIMFLRNSMCPGASMMMYFRFSVSKKQRAVSMVIPCARSSLNASSRKAYPKGLPVRRHSSRIDSILPSGREPVSARSRPMTVDLPWSTCPATTIFM